MAAKPRSESPMTPAAGSRSAIDVAAYYVVCALAPLAVACVVPVALMSNLPGSLEHSLWGLLVISVAGWLPWTLALIGTMRGDRRFAYLRDQHRWGAGAWNVLAITLVLLVGFWGALGTLALFAISGMPIGGP